MKVKNQKGLVFPYLFSGTLMICMGIVENMGILQTSIFITIYITIYIISGIIRVILLIAINKKTLVDIGFA